MLRSRREEQLALVVADAAGPLRSSAASLLELEGHAAESPREALRRVAYVDASVRARFLADPLAEATKAGLAMPEVQVLQHIDSVGLVLAARSFEHKRQQVRRAHSRWQFLWSK